ncbi:MAG: hypothetical protein WCG91_01640 [Candidatus Shapirobacteria bacterium]
MQTIEELIKDQNLNAQQAEAIKDYFNGLLIELLESIKQDHIKNFEETIDSLRNSA